ncbi:MAG: serine/threonine protein kinase [Myxococcota bacterium]
MEWAGCTARTSCPWDAMSPSRSCTWWGASPTGLSRLQHPNAIIAFDVGVCDLGPYLVMEPLLGQDLYGRILDVGGMEPEEARATTLAIASALESAHEQGIIHRDVKPANVFLHGPPGAATVKVLDFGIAKIMDSALDPNGAGGNSYETTMIDGKGPVLGSALYMAPEQIRSKRLDGRTDLYALGGLLHLMLVGRPPYPGKHAFEILKQHVLDPVPILSGCVPQPLADRCQRLLAKSPDDRPASAAAVVAELEQMPLPTVGRAMARRDDASLSRQPAMPRPTPEQLRAFRKEKSGSD